MAESLMFEVKITATGEVHDAEGNLLSSEPYESTAIMTEKELLEFLGQED